MCLVVAAFLLQTNFVVIDVHGDCFSSFSISESFFLCQNDVEVKESHHQGSTWGQHERSHSWDMYWNSNNSCHSLSRSWKLTNSPNIEGLQVKSSQNWSPAQETVFSPKSRLIAQPSVFFADLVTLVQSKKLFFINGIDSNKANTIDFNVIIEDVDFLERHMKTLAQNAQIAKMNICMDDVSGVTDF